ncbi:hypothetical protein PENANT_c006G11138 [Penicillium antarcticum]|uniref:Uncharacterized protein n=1 Tax=Penicillium antarcticum TaxID=416450 RepID=A0A1V6QCR7_9EURO|nr:hypothetical protein PENANT_c006G11138 [Penicillium antarcticum]
MPRCPGTNAQEWAPYSLPSRTNPNATIYLLTADCPRTPSLHLATPTPYQVPTLPQDLPPNSLTNSLTSSLNSSLINSLNILPAQFS